MKQPNEVESISYNPKFADCWTIVLDYGREDNEIVETLTCSDNPSHPQGVFSSSDGDLTKDGDIFKDWKDLPLSLQTFIRDYITENK
jgi:hypothetical protein